MTLTTPLMKSSLWLWLQHTYNGIGFETILPGLAGRADVIALDLLNRLVLMVEIKASRADFRSGKSKLAKDIYGNKANYCYLAAPAGVIPHDEVPEGWGLLEFTSDPRCLNIIIPAPLKPCPAAFFDFYIKQLLERAKNHMYSPLSIERKFNKL